MSPRDKRWEELLRLPRDVIASLHLKYKQSTEDERRKLPTIQLIQQILDHEHPVS